MEETSPIESGVPYPDSLRTRSILRKLEIGQSVVFSLKKRPSIQTMASALKRNYGLEFTVKKVDDENLRVWRTK